MLNITIARLRSIALALWLASPSRWFCRGGRK